MTQIADKDRVIVLVTTARQSIFISDERDIGSSCRVFAEIRLIQHFQHEIPGECETGFYMATGCHFRGLYLQKRRHSLY